MRCPKCGCQDDKVIDSRGSREGSTIRRRRECLACHFRFTTYEEIEHEGLMVVKRDGRREQVSKEKLLTGVRKACQKRPISPKLIEDMVERNYQLGLKYYSYSILETKLSHLFTYQWGRNGTFAAFAAGRA